MIATILILNLLDKDRKECWGLGKVGIWRLRSTLKEQKQTEGKWKCHPCSLPPYCPVWMPLPACRMEPPPIITQCTWALQPLASTAAATRGPHLSVRDAPRKERAAPGLGRPLCSLWEGGDSVPQGKGGGGGGPNDQAPNSKGGHCCLLLDCDLQQELGYTMCPTV